MEEVFKTRIEELNLEENEKEVILKNISVCAKMYWQGIKDITLNNNSDN